MVRPVGSDVNKAISLYFAASITKFTDNYADIVARCGRCGLFSALSSIYPQTVRDGYFGSRDGISEMEFNKILQVVKKFTTAFIFHKIMTHRRIFAGLRIHACPRQPPRHR